MSSPDPIHVLCTRSLTDEHLATLRAISPRLTVEYRFTDNRAELEGVLSPEVEVLFSTWSPASLEGLPRLRWFQGRSAGIDILRGSAVWNAGHVAITSASGIHVIAMAEYVTGMMIALARDFRGYVEMQRRKAWPERSFVSFPGRELRGATILIVGYGSVGREVGRQSHALGLRVLAVKRDPTQRRDHGYTIPGTGDPDGTIPEHIVGPDRLDDLLPEAEYVVIASALTPSSRGLFGEAQLRRMRSDALLINIGRGGIVDETALLRALRERRIGGAALDVFAERTAAAGQPALVARQRDPVAPRVRHHAALR